MTLFFNSFKNYRYIYSENCFSLKLFLNFSFKINNIPVGTGDNPGSGTKLSQNSGSGSKFNIFGFYLQYIPTLWSGEVGYSTIMSNIQKRWKTSWPNSILGIPVKSGIFGTLHYIHPSRSKVPANYIPFPTSRIYKVEL